MYIYIYIYMYMYKYMLYTLYRSSYTRFRMFPIISQYCNTMHLQPFKLVDIADSPNISISIYIYLSIYLSI